MSMSIPTSSLPLRERVNFRIIIFVGVFVALLGWPLYTFLDASISGGIKNHGDYFDVDLKAMSSFIFDQENGSIDDVPKVWRELDGKTVVMEGEVAPGTSALNDVGGKFDLVYSVQKCCMSGAPQIQHFVKVSVPSTARVDASDGGVIRVKGKLKVNVTRDPETGRINGVYHVIADGVSSV